MNINSVGGESISQLVGDKIKASKLKISVAESLTSGKLQDKIASVSGISSCFEGGVTAYSIDSKVNVLGVDRNHAEVVNCVSQKVAEQMATGVSKVFSTEIGIATTGYAESFEFNGASFKQQAFYAIFINGGMISGHVDSLSLGFEGGESPSREQFREAVSIRVLEVLNECLPNTSKE